MHFGINTDMFQLRGLYERPVSPIRIFAAGNDRTRDWDMMFRAFGTVPRFAVKLACRWVSSNQIPAYPNVELVPTPSMATFQELYGWADFVAIPMHENKFSGITDALEAAALGIPVLLARTGAVPTYFDDEAVLYYPAGDAEALLRVAASANVQERRIRAAGAHAIFQQHDYSTQALVRQYVAISQDVMPTGLPIAPLLDAGGADATA